MNRSPKSVAGTRPVAYTPPTASTGAAIRCTMARRYNPHTDTERTKCHPVGR